jgi:hypothetical protein
MGRRGRKIDVDLETERSFEGEIAKKRRKQTAGGEMNFN